MNIFEDKIILLEWKQPFACTVLMFSLSNHIVIGCCVKRVIKTCNVSHNLERTVKKKKYKYSLCLSFGSVDVISCILVPLNRLTLYMD